MSIGVQFNLKTMIAFTSLVASYGSLSVSVDLQTTFFSIFLIFVSLTWVLWPNFQLIEDDSKLDSRLPLPWLAFALGFGLMILGAYLYFPKAEDFALQQFWIAVEYGYDDHFEESETIGLGMVFLTFFIGVPLALVISLIFAKVSGMFRTSGLGRYSLAFLFAILPLVTGTIVIAIYWLIANWLQKT